MSESLDVISIINSTTPIYIDDLVIWKEVIYEFNQKNQNSFDLKSSFIEFSKSTFLHRLIELLQLLTQTNTFLHEDGKWLKYIIEFIS